MAFAAWLPKVRYHSEHCNERTCVCYHQAPPWVRVVAHVGDAGQAKPHLEHNPLSLLGTCHAMALRKLNDPGCQGLAVDTAPAGGADAGQVHMPLPEPVLTHRLDHGGDGCGRYCHLPLSFCLV